VHVHSIARPDTPFKAIDPGSFFRKGGLVCLVGAIAISPRILLPVVLPERQFDIRAEDLLVALCVVGWLLNLAGRPRLFLSPLFSTISFYVIIVAFSTGIAMITLGLSPARAVPFFVKELEYFVIFLLVANWVRTPGDLKFTGMALIGGGLLNAAWVGVQLFTGVKTQLLHVVGLHAGKHILLAAQLFDSYGPALIGETSPLATGGFFLLIFLLAFSYMLMSQTAPVRLIYLTICGVLFSCLMFSDSRVAVGGGVIGLVTLAALNRKGLRTVLVVGGLTLATAIVLNQAFVRYEEATGVSVLVYNKNAGMAVLDRLSFAKVERALRERQDKWEALLSDTPSLLVGSGKGSIGLLHTPGLDWKEAHNHYLRVLLESGVFGLVAFVWLLIGIGLFCARVYTHASLTQARIVSGAALAATVGLSAGALFQDVFTPVILNEVWWVLIGLTAAAYRIERRERESRLGVAASV
jgi:hypothetical protein